MKAGKTESIQAEVMNRRPAAGLQDLLPAVIAFVLIAIVGAIGALILVNFQTNIGIVGGNYIAYNAVGQGITGITTIMSYLPLIALVIVAAILIGIVLVAFSFGGNKSERF